MTVELLPFWCRPYLLRLVSVVILFALYSVIFSPISSDNVATIDQGRCYISIEPYYKHKITFYDAKLIIEYFFFVIYNLRKKIYFHSIIHNKQKSPSLASALSSWRVKGCEGQYMVYARPNSNFVKEIQLKLQFVNFPGIGNKQSVTTAQGEQTKSSTFILYQGIIFRVKLCTCTLVQ